MAKAVLSEKQSGNIYLPAEGRIKKVIDETSDVRRFIVIPRHNGEYAPGEFFMLSVWGAGEIPISTSSLYDEKGVMEFCIRSVGRVSSRIYERCEGEALWFRGPYGRGFPLDDFRERDILLVAGGIGMAPLRPLLQLKMKDPGKGKLMLIYGSRDPDQIIFREDAGSWKGKGIETILTVDEGNGSWKGNIGLVTEYLDNYPGKWENTRAYICGPDLMMRITVKRLLSTGLAGKNIFCTCEKHMKCGVGKCGHCYSGSRYVCVDGPVFNGDELLQHNII